MKKIIHTSAILLCFFLFHSNSFAQQSRNNNKSSNPYRSSYQRMATGSNSSFSFEIRNGTLWASGDNRFGQLGDGSIDNQSTPVKIGLDDNWVIIATGQFHTIGLKSDGSLWAWGMNAFGQLGDHSYDDRHTPTRIGNDNNWISISAGGIHTLALKSDGTLWAWGSNIYGELGDGTNTRSFTPIQVGTDNKWAGIAAGYSHSLGLKSDGSFWAWGENTYGQLGNGSTVNQSTPVKIGSDNNWTSISGGSFHTVALKSDGSLWLWGINGNYQLGDGTNIARNAPVRLGVDNNWAGIAAGGHYTVALKSDGTLWAWGSNNYGQLGDGTNTGKIAPIQVGTDNKWVSITTGSEITLALKSDGTLWAWGKNTEGQLGDGTIVNKNSPTNIQPALDAWIVEANGRLHSIAIKGDGTLWAWGNNFYGQLGDGINGTNTEKKTAVQIGTDNNWISIAAGEMYSVGLKSDGTLWTWGRNEFGQLGDGTYVNKNTPVQIGTDKDWANIAAGITFTVALKSDGSLWSWGYNYFGQLGDGTTEVRNSPGRVGTENNWVSIRAGGFFTIGLKSDGTLWAWGSNEQGQIGDNTNDSKYFPFQVGTDKTWTSISPGYFHTRALKSDGTLWAWGLNSDGQLGDGTIVGKNIPTQIGTDNNWIISPEGAKHSIAVKSDGTLWSWGFNYNGELGDGTNVNKVAPTKIASQQNVVGVGKGIMAFVSAVIKVDRGIICLTGNNLYGQLGDGTTNNSNIFICSNSICTSFNLATANTTYDTRALSGIANRTDFQLGCNLVASLIPAGTTPIDGYATAKVFIDNSVQNVNGQPYLQRHFDIEPQNDDGSPNPASATADVILYFTQGEFDAFNLVRGTFNSLPINGADNEDYKANIRVTQYHGLPTGGNNPGNYSQAPGNASLITPTSIIWDARNNWWAISFPVTGFSGFFLSSKSRGPLDVSLMRFTAKRTSGIANRLDWSTATEDANTNFDITRSDNGISFKTLSEMNGKGNNSDYTYYDDQPLSGTNYYRLKISSGNNKISYSDIAIVRNGGGSVTIAPVPAHNTVTIRNSDASLNGRMAFVSDMQGREVLRFTMAEIKNLDISTLTSGVYSLRLPSGEVVRLVKQ